MSLLPLIPDLVRRYVLHLDQLFDFEDFTGDVGRVFVEDDLVAFMEAESFESAGYGVSKRDAGTTKRYFVVSGWCVGGACSCGEGACKVVREEQTW